MFATPPMKAKQATTAFKPDFTLGFKLATDSSCRSCVGEAVSNIEYSPLRDASDR